MKRFQKIAVLTYCALTTAAFAAEEHQLSDITVKGEAVSIAEQPATINSVTSEDIEKLYIQRPEELLEEVTGADVGNYNQGGVANTFMLRGFAGAGHGGDAAVFIDGITLNESEGHADGYADMNVIIPLEIDHVDVFKGPSSALYGNFARGGVVSFNTKKGSEYNKLRLEYGTYNTFNTQGAFGIKLGEKFHNNTAIQYFHTDGYQENSKWLRGNFSTRFSFKPTDKLEFAASGRVHGSEWEGPGYIPKSQFDDRDEAMKQAVNAENDGGSKRYYAGRFDVGVSFTDQLKLLGWIYGTQQDFTRFAKFGYRPGNQTDTTRDENGYAPVDDNQTERFYDRRGFGIGTSLNYKGMIGSFPTSAVAGVEYFVENTDWYRWNTYNRSRLEQTQARYFSVGTLSEFAQVDMEFVRYFRPLLGIRVDHFFGEDENRDPGTPVEKGEINDYTGISPKAGFTSSIIDPLDFRMSFSQGYILPDGEAKYDPTLNVDPVDIRQYETGLSFNLDKKIAADVSGYILDTDNEIREKVPDSGEFTNIGKTRRMGIEFGINAAPVKGLELTGQIGAIKSEIVESPVKEDEGKEVPGVPQYIANVGARYTSPIGLGLGMKFRKIGEYQLDESNATQYEGYGVLNGDVFYTIDGRNDNKYRLFLSVDNITDNHYSQSVWEGYGTLNYAVSSPRTFTGGVQIDW